MPAPGHENQWVIWLPRQQLRASVCCTPLPCVCVGACVQPVGAEAAADIEKDLGRTFPATRRFASAEGQETLMRVLRAYAALDPEVRWGCLNLVVCSQHKAMQAGVKGDQV